MFLSFREFLGHFHPSLVHLPIGILLVGLLLQLMARKEKFRSFQAAIPVVFFCGAISATLSCITGYLLSISDDYDHGLVTWHMWMAISVMIVSWILYGKERNPGWRVNKQFLLITLLSLVIVAGHLGGSLTHGSDYITKPLRSLGKDSGSSKAIPPLTDVQNAFVYTDIIKPILETKCYSCHGPNKQKGKFRMDDSTLLMKGGKKGKEIEPGNADASELIKRVMLPVDNDDHMPPKEKSQPTENQLALLHWWISTGADLNKKVNQMDQPEKLKPALLSLQKAPEIKKVDLSIPSKPVEKADVKIIEQLKDDNIVVIPVAQNSNYLTVSFVTDSIINAEDLKRLLELKKQLIWLKIGNTNLNDEQLEIIGQLKNLVRLNLERTLITDKGLAKLKSLENLRYLNLVGTQVSASGILQLKDLTTLNSLYLYQTIVDKKDSMTLKNAFPKAEINLGGYVVGTLVGDTSEVKEKREY